MDGTLKLEYIWIDQHGNHIKNFYPPDVETAIDLANLIADSDLEDDNIKLNTFELYVNIDGDEWWETWEDEYGANFERVAFYS